MSMKGLSSFLAFDTERFFADKKLVLVKTEQWANRNEEGAVTEILGTKATLMIVEEKTDYGRDISNFGAQFVVKVPDMAPSAFSKLTPLSSEVVIKDVEKASVYGDYRNELSITAKLATKSA